MNECRGGGPWINFKLIPDKNGTEEDFGSLDVDPHNGDDITGKRIKGTTRDPFTGKCKLRPNRVRTISFIIEMEKRLYFFGGIVTGRNVNGTYYVIAKTGITAAAAPDPGDTGTWGGSQGALLKKVKNKRTKKSGK